MPDSIKVEIKGLDELEKALVALGQDTGAHAIVNGAYNANKIVQDTMKEAILSANAYDTGLLHKSITRKKKIYASDGTVSVITGVSASTKGVDKRGEIRRPIRYAHIVEKHKPFAKYAYNTTRQQVLENFKEYLKRIIARHTK